MSATDLENPDHFPAEQRGASLKGPAGRLEVMLDVAEGGPARAVAVICHSVSAEGGSLHSKVVQMMERSLRELGAHTIRLNFRGVGESEGHFDRGFGESEDLLAVCQWSRHVQPDLPLWLAGYGFGAYVTARAAPSVMPQHLTSVAPLIDQFDFSPLPRAECPWMIVQGDTDECVVPDAVYSWAQELPGDIQFIPMEDADHEFHRRLMDLRGVLKNGIKRQLDLTDR
ncbi:MAG: alpha/beta family hydrolase [Pseudomonadota bacterium]